MILYLDESYDKDKKFLLLGVLFCPIKTKKILLKKINDLKDCEEFFFLKGSESEQKRKYYKEIKYSEIRGHKRLRMAKKFIDLFCQSNAFFRAIVIKKSDLNLENFGHDHEPKALKEARIYKKFAEILISPHLKNTKFGKLYADELLHCQEDRFCEAMELVFKKPKFHGWVVPTLRSVKKVDSSSDKNQLIQMTDLLLGTITCELNISKDPEKINLKAYLLSKLEKKSFLEENWSEADEYRQYSIRYWKSKP